MGTLVNFGSAMGSYWMNQAAVRASDAAAKLASGQRVTGKGGGGDIAAYYTQRSNAVTNEIDARKWANDAAAAYGNAAFAEGAALLQAKLNEAPAAGPEATALGTSITAALAAFSTFSIADATTFTYTETSDGIGASAEAAGIAAGIEAIALGKAASASLAREAAENFIAVDFGVETANVTRYQILQQAAAAMIAQANQSQNVVLALLK